ncbi:MAG: response regulator [Candidatus Methanomarinus sp.]|uniref:Response regulator n=1 Tax=Candidatus Methanomarinus sp. TaxID=3386244 RepID=A0AC61S9P3_9EURY|nr:MAG: DNA-binding response regulator, OmpR family, contains REC and winged-helix (wHTH) domain [ANME-2 cluster archaeon]KAF5427217.1 DNA-binding response regulator, OmpR family, contains REC and winged-helix (wHTH) domain [ANME-2 cluster archaeon]TKY91275.1 MAG: response regulator [ANME-2 cluster archaeon]
MDKTYEYIIYNFVITGKFTQHIIIINRLFIMHWREQELIDILEDGRSTTTEVVNRSHMCKVTALKYLEGLKKKGDVNCENIGTSKVWFLQNNDITNVPSEKKIKVLIVDDDKNVLTIIREALGYEPFEILEAENGKEALGMAFTHSPDILVMDIMMPHMDGYQVCKELKKHEYTKTIPIIILSAKSSVDDKLKAMNLNINDYIVKPFDPRELKARIKMVLNQSMHTEVNA